jgi:hypothetical protein
MNACKVLLLAVIPVVLMTAPVAAQHGSGHSNHGGGAFGSSRGRVWPYAPAIGFGGFYGAYPPIVMIAPGGFFPGMQPMPPGFLPAPGPLLAPPPPGFLQDQTGIVRRASAKRSDVPRSTQLVTLGDRFFRAGNLKKAEERYQQAQRAAPEEAGPRVRLAQIAFVRGAYGEAASRLREALTVQPGWLITAGDIQSLYGEPADFARHMARLGSYVQTHPEDRDAWLVLGAQFFLTGRTVKAADIFKRLNDPRRKADAALSAFLDASNQGGAEPPKPTLERAEALP